MVCLLVTVAHYLNRSNIKIITELIGLHHYIYLCDEFNVLYKCVRTDHLMSDG